jgi:hypothetical protein
MMETSSVVDIRSGHQRAANQPPHHFSKYPTI